MFGVFLCHYDTFGRAAYALVTVDTKQISSSCKQET
jgi:hypothetical protein